MTDLSCMHVHGLCDVPETMLWTLHNRASEAMRPGTPYPDSEAVRIYQSIDYDYQGSFGIAEPSHAVRSAMVDRCIQEFVARHPGASIVNLGEGLETQRYRLAHLPAHWFSVDVAEAIAIREQFIAPDDDHQHIVASALDTRWCEAIPPHQPVLITAQGLLMYFEEDDVRQLVQAISHYFPSACLIFDTIPKWLSRKTCSDAGWQKTPTYRTPAMPWGINRDAIEPTLSQWIPGHANVDVCPYDRFPSGVISWLFPLVNLLPRLKHRLPAMVRVEYGGKS